MEYFTEFGYVGLFAASFLAATILPLSSEVVLGFLLLNSFNPAALVAVATCGNVLGSLTNYLIGFWGSAFLVNRVVKISGAEAEKARQRFKKYGVFSLLFAWVPIVGDPLTFVAGVLKVNLLIFFILVTFGKLMRYVALSYVLMR